MYSAEVIREYSETSLCDILSAYRDAMPEEFQFPDAKSYFRAQLDNRKTIHILLRRDANPIGYLLAIPHDEAVSDSELLTADPELKPDPTRLYIDTMEISPEYAKSLIGGKLCLMILQTLHEEAGRRGICNFSMHTRINTGLNKALRKIYGNMLTQFRIIDNWPFYNCEEPTEYIEGTYLKKNDNLRGLSNN